MICEECRRDRPLTYRVPSLGLRSVCADCVRDNHPETLTEPATAWDDPAADPVGDILETLKRSRDAW